MKSVRTYSNVDGHFMEIGGSNELLKAIVQELTNSWEELEFTFHEEKVVISNFSNVAAHLEVQFDDILGELGMDVDLLYGPKYYNQRISEVSVNTRRLFISNERLSRSTTFGKNSPIKYNEIIHYPDAYFVFKLFSYPLEETVLIPIEDEIMGYKPQIGSRVSLPQGVILNLPFFPTMIIIHGEDEAQQFFSSFIKMDTYGIISNKYLTLPKEGESKLFYL